MARPFTVACVQTSSGRDMTANVEAASGLVREARDAGAEFILLPENVALMAPGSQATRDHAAPADEHPALQAFRRLSGEVDAWLLVGSLPVRSSDGRVANCSFLVGPAGESIRNHAEP